MRGFALQGKRFGRLLVIESAGKSKHGYNLWQCRCDCGSVKAISASSLNRGASSCGCIRREKLASRNRVHGLYNLPERAVWNALRQRCNNPNDPAYPNYGGRGIKVCSRWNKSFEAFISDMGRRPSKHHTIERIDNSKGYNKNNCAWVSRQQNNRNKRIYKQNKTGHRGISMTKQGRFHVAIGNGGRNIYLGRFDTLDEAIAARKAAEEALWGNPVTR